MKATKISKRFNLMRKENARIMKRINERSKNIDKNFEEIISLL